MRRILRENNMIGNWSKSFLMLAMVSMVGMSVPATAEASPEIDVTQFENMKFPMTEVTVFGRTIQVQTMRLTQSSLLWDDLKSYLPEDIANAPAEPMTYKEIFDTVEAMSKQAGLNYRRQLDRIARKAAKREHGEDFTELQYDIKYKALAEQFHVPGGDEISPMTRKAHDKYFALSHLTEMLREAFGYGEARI